jgi:mono/diheme cytochrome c family protein
LPHRCSSLRGAAADGAAVFEKNCATCHGMSGQSDTAAAKAMKVPPLAGDADVAGATIDDLVARVKAGEKHGAMLKKLSDDDVRAATEHAKSLAAAE